MPAAPNSSFRRFAMTYFVLAFVFAAGFATAHFTTLTTAADQQPGTPGTPPPTATPNNVPPNPNIDMAGYINAVQTAAKQRESHRLTEEDFLKMSKEEG